MTDLWVKICGVTSVDDALMVADAGADAIGLNFAPASKRYISPERAAEIVRAVGSRVEWVGVFVNAPREHILRVRKQVGLDWVQLHGEETPALLRSLEVPAYKALRISGPEDVHPASLFGGDRLLVDSKVAGAHGGTGEAFNWLLIEELRQMRAIVLAGGIHPENVAAAVREVRPFGVDTASGVESAPGIKDRKRVEAFVHSAREAQARLIESSPPSSAPE